MPTHSIPTPKRSSRPSRFPIPLIEEKRERIILVGDVPSPVNPPSGCRFHTRCPLAIDICKHVDPEFRDVGGQHYVACHVV